MFNTLRTFALLAAMTALFMVVGYFIGGTAGMMIAFLFAAGTNLFPWNAPAPPNSMTWSMCFPGAPASRPRPFM
jgi:hypothetical protein